MAPEASETDIAGVVSHIGAHGGQAFVSRGVMRTIIGVVGTEEVLETLDADSLPGVAETMRITAPYKLVSAQNHARRTTVRVGGVPIGPDTFTLIAGPCAVESAEQTLEAARMAKRAGATLLRGGAYKPRTSPYAFQGLGVDGLRILAEVREEVRLPIVTEVMDVADVDVVAEYADMLQIGTRNMQNFGLLQAVGAAGKPVMLKRGLSATYEEWLMAAEYIAQRGNLDIVLCERGVRSFEPAIRNMLDVSAVADDAAAVAPADHRRPVARRRPPRPGRAAGPGRHRRRRRRRDGRRAPPSRDRALRRRAGACRGRARGAGRRGDHDPRPCRPDGRATSPADLGVTERAAPAPRSPARSRRRRRPGA